MRVYILLFNARTDNEGIYSIQLGDRNMVLMFESSDDAERYAMQLEAQDFPPPTVEAIDSQEVEEFCQGAGYEWQLIKEGMLAIPPEKNLEQTDWSAEQKEETKETDSEMSNSELENLRRRLEGLL